MGLLDFLAPAEPAPTTWRRLRYGSADKASQALSLLGQAGFPLEIRCRVDETARLPQLIVGGAEPAFRALEAMAADHALLLDVVDRPPKALAGNWVPGSLDVDRPALDVRVAANGMFVRQTGTRDQRRQAGAPVRLPTPAVGFAIQATLPFVEEPPTTPTWRVGAGGFNGPAGVFGLPSSILRLISATARAAFAEDERGTLVIDAGEGALSQVLRRDPETIRLLNDGRIRDLSISRSAQAGFAPLAEAQDPADTSLRWHWLFRGLGVETPHLDAALATGVRSVGDLGEYLDADPAMASTGHAVRGLLEAEGGQVSRWLSGDADIVSHLLAVSDNNAAEVVAHHVGLAQGTGGSFEGGVAGVRRALRALEIPLAKSRILDGSGLSRQNRLAPETLSAVLRVAASPEHPQLRVAVTGMPVAGYTGSLTWRFDRGAAAGRGRVQAKTGTLTGVHGLAGVVSDTQGSTFGFVMIADQVPLAKQLTARILIDEAAAALAACACGSGTP